MKPRIHVITLAVEDLERSVRFYQDLGFPSAAIVGTEHVGDAVNPAGGAALFELHDGFLFMLYPRSDLAKDAKIPPSAPSSGDFSLGHAVPSREEVDAVLSAAEAAGAALTENPRERPWGIYSGYFRDPDGHLWEILWNPGLTNV